MGVTNEKKMDRRRALKTILISASACMVPGIASFGVEKLVRRLLSIDDPLSFRSLYYMLQMGHCAPAILQTLLEVDTLENKSLVKLSAGLPGGIGNQGGECGGVTAAAIHLGILSGDEKGMDVKNIFKIGHRYLARFQNIHGSLNCREIQNSQKGIRPCLRVICSSPGLLKKTISESLPSNRESKVEMMNFPYLDLLNEWQKHEFHCGQSVFQKLNGFLYMDQTMKKALLGFLGGTLLTGRTCSALAAGVMAIGARIGEIENSRFRVLKMVYEMMTGGDAMNDKINRFNKSIHAGSRLAGWFNNKYGTTLCQEMTQCDFSTISGIQAYISQRKISFCQKIAVAVSEQVKNICQNSNFPYEGDIMFHRGDRKVDYDSAK